MLVLALCEVLALGIIAWYSACNFSFRESLDIVVGFGVGYMTARIVYSRSDLSCTGGRVLLLIVGTLLAIYSIYSMKVWSAPTDFSLEMPNLTSDDGGYYSWALSHYDGRCPSPQVTYKGVPLFMLLMWRVLGVSIVWPLALNYTFALLSIVITGKTANRLLSRHFASIPGSSISLGAMLIVSLLCFLLSQTVRIQKEASCMLGFVLVGYSLVGMSEIEKASNRRRWTDLMAFSLGTLLLALVRTNVVYFVALGAVMMSFSNKMAHWKRGAVLAILSLSLTFLFNYLFNYTIEHQMVILNGGDAMARDFKINGAQQPYLSLIGNYYYFPHWKRLLLLPITTGIQYIIPFPWVYDLQSSDVMSLLPRVRLMWYIVGGACIYYYLYINVVHYKNRNLGMWAWWPLASFALMAYVTGGLVSRYALPLQPLFAVIALFVFLRVKQGLYRRSFMIWMCVYTFVLLAVLQFGYLTQSENLNKIHALDKTKTEQVIHQHKK